MRKRILNTTIGIMIMYQGKYEDPDIQIKEMIKNNIYYSSLILDAFFKEIAF
jgi:hypothetical protein